MFRENVIEKLVNDLAAKEDADLNTTINNMDEQQRKALSKHIKEKLPLYRKGAAYAINVLKEKLHLSTDEEAHRFLTTIAEHGIDYLLDPEKSNLSGIPISLSIARCIVDNDIKKATINLAREYTVINKKINDVCKISSILTPKLALENCAHKHKSCLIL